MSEEVLQSKTKKHANFRICYVSSFATELLEIHADQPAFHVLFIPGNPGVVTLYKDFVESLYNELLGGRVSVTAVGYVAHTKQNWEQGRLFSLQEQIDHKVDFIKQEFPNNEISIILIGHSLGAHISIEAFKRIPEKVFYCTGLYPFLAVDFRFLDQFILDKISKNSTISVAFSSVVWSSGRLPNSIKRFVVSKALGKSCSSNTVEAVSSHLTRYHTMRSLLFNLHTAFNKRAETPNWAFMREKKDKIAFLFGSDDPWGPMQICEEISRKVPGVALSIEREGHGHFFCCFEDGSIWLAHHVGTLINNQISSSRSIH